jgi:pyrroline-5-carboxylate reductase
VARHEGVALLCCAPSDSSLYKDAAAPACQGRNDNGLAPATKTVESIFQAMGGVVTLQSETEFEACMVTTAIMGPLYGIMREGRDWLLRQTSLSQQEASYLIVKQYVGAIQDAGSKVGDDQLSLDSGHLLDELIKEQTQGGLNEQALHNLDKLQGLDAQRRIMDALLARLRGESDGFI